MTHLSGLPPVDATFEPAWVRNGSTQVKQDYRTAQAFEEMLVEQLAGSLTEAGGIGGTESESEGQGEGGLPKLGGGAASAMLPQALSRGILAGGGLGLAEQLTRQLEGTQGRHAAGGSSAGTTSPPAAIAPTSGGTATAKGTAA
jgi:Rod binding domain-containing protein